MVGETIIYTYGRFHRLKKKKTKKVHTFLSLESMQNVNFLEFPKSFHLENSHRNYLETIFHFDTS